jgi:hypothetical protein
LLDRGREGKNWSKRQASTEKAASFLPSSAAMPAAAAFLPLTVTGSFCLCERTSDQQFPALSHTDEKIDFFQDPI